ncbi:hypothetical protein MMC13_000012 [Lambiella insularis]|nr:hypothetical protein [Lambiella insularis]
MPVSHIGLTVSNLPAFCSFFLAALSPLGYKYFGQQGNQIGFGIDQAEFFICQQSHSTPPGLAHVAFSAQSAKAVNSFFTSALRAGGRIHGEPATRDSNGYYSAGVLDLDGNSIEVVHRPEDDLEKHMALTRITENKQVNKWQDESARSVVSQSPAIESSPLRTIVNNITRSTLVMPQNHTSNNDTVPQTLIGTLIGAAAGAAIAYAMSKAEPESTSRQSQEPAREIVYQTVEAPLSSFRPDTSPRTYYSPSQVSYRQSPRSQHFSSYQRAIEAPPSPGSRVSIARSQSDLACPSYHAPPRPVSLRSVTSTEARTVVQADYPPAASVHGSRKTSVVSLKEDGPAPSGHKSRKTSVVSQHEDDRRSTVSKTRHSSYQDFPPSPAGPIVEEIEDVDFDAACSVAPSDSISQAGSKRSRHRHKSRHDGRSRSEREREGKRSVVSMPTRDVAEERQALGMRSVVSQFLGR